MEKVTISHYESLQQFPNDTAARLCLEERRWHGKLVCPLCGEIERVQVRKVVGYFRCLACKQDFTVRTGTIFERFHVPLDTWLYAMYLVATARKGISSMQISKELGITQKSAWFMLKRIREVCGNDPDGPTPLSGVVEADETCLGGKEKNEHAKRKLRSGRGTVGKTAVLGMLERGGDTKATVIPNTGSDTIQACIRANVAKGSTLCTDEASAYDGMKGYRHRAINHSAKEYLHGSAHEWH